MYLHCMEYWHDIHSLILVLLGVFPMAMTMYVSYVIYY